MTTVTPQPATARSGSRRSTMRALEDLGQSVWLDYLRGIVRSGELESVDYDDALRDPALSRKTDRELFEILAIQDVRAAAASPAEVCHRDEH
jgi:hypothetical protein